MFRRRFVGFVKRLLNPNCLSKETKALFYLFRDYCAVVGPTVKLFAFTAERYTTERSIRLHIRKSNASRVGDWNTVDFRLVMTFTDIAVFDFVIIRVIPDRPGMNSKFSVFEINAFYEKNLVARKR